LVGAAICAAFAPTEYLVFTKTEWIDDCGFLISEKDVELPRNFDGRKAKIRCFTECLHLLGSGWSNEIAERNREMMEKYLVGDNA
jgi:hypothetical protein